MGATCRIRVPLDTRVGGAAGGQHAIACEALSHHEAQHEFTLRVRLGPAAGGRCDRPTCTVLGVLTSLAMKKAEMDSTSSTKAPEMPYLQAPQA